MSNGNGSSSSGGIGFGGLLGIVFITLKLLHKIDWSWWWVTAPLWGGFALLAAIAILIGAASFVDDGIQGRKRRRALEKARERARLTR